MSSDNEHGMWKLSLGGVRIDPAAAACRYALTSLTGGRDVEISNEVKMLEALDDLVALRRARLLALQREGWGHIEDARRLQFALNCPPAGVTTKGVKSYPCKQYRICPFCWCRKYVLDLFARLYGLWKQYDVTTLPFDLLEVRTEYLYPQADYLASVPFDWIKHGKSAYYRAALAKAYGGFVLCTVEPPNYSDKLNEPCYRLYHRVLALVPKFLPTPPEEVAPLAAGESQTVKRTVHRTYNPGNRALSATVGRICIYPAQLVRGNAGDTVEILDAQSMLYTRDSQGRDKKKFPVRMSEFYGVLRKQTSAMPGPVLAHQ